MPLRQATILIVDDNPLNIKLIEQSLSLDGYISFISTTDPLDVESIVLENKVDMILLDINMPLLDGFGVLSLLRKIFESKIQPPILMVTAQQDFDNRIKALSMGASDFILKPFNREELLKRVEVHLQNWFFKNQLANDNQILEDKVHERTLALEQAHLEVVFRLGRAAEYRDNETGNHVKRVSLFSKALAKQAGLPEKECHLIELAAPMHDVGKIGISDTILLKPGKLTELEYIEMQRHVEIGGEILSGANDPILKCAYEIAMTHHEKFNGKGYPNGLKGEEIPISGRIVGLVDVFDALTSSRPYKRAWSIESALELIENERNQHFDPFLVDCFFEILPEIKRLSGKFTD